MSYRKPSGMRPSADLRRRRTIERRRNVLFSLVGVAVATLLLGILGVKMMLAVHLMTDLLLAGYVMLLARMRTMAAERDMKLRYLPKTAGRDEDVTAWGDLSDLSPAYAIQ